MTKRKSKLKKINPITEHEAGTVELNMSGDLVNDDWLRTARLLDEGDKE